MSAVVLTPKVAAAGGFDLPDLGTEALGRGGAFVAKASDGSAIYYNPAGLSHQRGTHVLANGNLYFHSFQFQRLGTYPEDSAAEPAATWGGTVYPRIRNSPQLNIAPLAAITTDFGYFDRLTLAAGIFSPSSLSKRTFPLSTTEKTPSPSRYDFVQSQSSTFIPTLAAGVRVTKWLDLGVSGHLVLANISQTMVGYSDFGADVCKENGGLREDRRCDTENTINASGSSFGATIGALIRPSRSVAIGATFRTPVNITATGTLSPKPPAALPNGTEFKTGAAQYAYQLPWLLRLGARYVSTDLDFEVYDLELDVTYEAWGTAQKAGPILQAPEIGNVKDVNAVILHGYNNTFSARGGGSYNIELGSGVLALRGGAYFDSSSTADYTTTRLDWDTLPKVAGTIGVGYKVGAFSFDFAYAAVASMPRTVAQGAAIRPINLYDGGSTRAKDASALPAVNAGLYQGFTNIVSLGVGVAIDAFLGPPRKTEFGNAWEPNYGGPVEPAEAAPPKPGEQADKPAESPAPKTPELPAEMPAEKPESPPPSAPEVKPAPAPEVKPVPLPVPVPAPVPAPEVKPVPAPAPAPPPKKKERKPPSKRTEWWENPG